MFESGYYPPGTGHYIRGEKEICEVCGGVGEVEYEEDYEPDYDDYYER